MTVVYLSFNFLKKKKKKVDMMVVSKVLCDLRFSLDQPLKSALVTK